MSHIAPKEFFDEYDVYYHLKKIIKKERYNKPFLCMYELLIINNRPHITTRALQERACIPNHSEAYQLLSSLAILQLFKRELISGRATLFKPINKDWWEIAKKELDKQNGDTRKN